MGISWTHIFNYFDNPDWVSAIGQWVGAIATFWAVIVALQQAKEARIAQQKAESDAKEALRTGMALSVKWEKDDNDRFTYFFISATNIKRVPVFIDKAYIMYQQGKKWHLFPDEHIQTDAPELVKYGDRCEIKVSYDALLACMEERDKQMFDFIFNTSLHEQFPVGMMIEHNKLAGCTYVYLEALPLMSKEEIEWDEEYIRTTWMIELQSYSKKEKELEP